MTPLQPDISYHIFNHANGFENVFSKEENFRYFLTKYRKYISPIAETYAYCLMPNHFHLVVRMRKRAVIEALIINNFSKVSNTNNINRKFFSSSAEETSMLNNSGKVEKGKVSDNEIEKFLSKQFANLFSCYTQSFNKVYRRMGSLFIKNFKRETIADKTHFMNVVAYTHRNPIHHGFCTNYEQWNYSSYLEIKKQSDDFVEATKLIKLFGGFDEFLKFHQDKHRQFEESLNLDIPES